MSPLVLAQIDGDRDRSRPVECYRSGVRGRFICLSRWPELPEKWCCGCGRIARIADRLGATIAVNNSGPGECANTPRTVARPNEEVEA